VTCQYKTASPLETETLDWEPDEKNDQKKSLEKILMSFPQVVLRSTDFVGCTGSTFHFQLCEFHTVPEKALRHIQEKALVSALIVISRP